jgi:hypothetical protein
MQKEKINMFLGYQNDKIAFVAETKEELENLPCVSLDRIEETTGEYVLYNGSYVLKAQAESEQAEEDKQARISELKQMLAETDYVVIKIAEGEATREEYEPILEDRQKWRAEINELQID